MVACLTLTRPAVITKPKAMGRSDAQRAELRARLARHRAHPEEPVVTLVDIRRRLTGGRRDGGSFRRS